MNDIHALYDLWCEKAVLDADLIEELRVDKYIADPLSGFGPTNGFCLEFLKGMKRLHKPKFLNPKEDFFVKHIWQLERMLKNELGITVDMAATSPSANGMTLVKPMTERQKEVIMESIDDVYDTFAGKVAEGRNLAKDKVFEMAEGRVWSGSQAVENGLADANGTLHDAIIKAKDMADLGDKFTLYEMKTPLTPFEAWLDAMGMMTAKACGIDYNIYGDELKEVIKNNVELFTNNGVLMAMPQNIEVNF